MFEPNGDFYNLTNKLAPFHDEIPFGSLALLGYVISTFNESKNVALSINWAVVLATPPPLGSTKMSAVASGSKLKAPSPTKSKAKKV